MKRLALVTGGSRGIGHAVAKQLHEEGWQVAITSRSLDRAIHAAEAISTDTVGIAYEAGNATNALNVVRELTERFGKPITGLVNAAGETHNALLLRLREEDALRMVETNMLGTLYMTKSVAKSMLQARQGSIVTLGSVVGSRGNVGQCAYSMSKASLIGMTTSLAKEFGQKNIRVNLIEPGFIATDMTASNMSDESRQKTLERIVLGTFGSPDDIAHTVAFLLSDKAAYITGQTIRVDGGLIL